MPPPRGISIGRCAACGGSVGCGMRNETQASALEIGSDELDRDTLDALQIESIVCRDQNGARECKSGRTDLIGTNTVPRIFKHVADKRKLRTVQGRPRDELVSLLLPALKLRSFGAGKAKGCCDAHASVAVRCSEATAAQDR